MTAEWSTSESNRAVRCYTLTDEGRKQLDAEMDDYSRVHEAIQAVLRHA